MGGKSATFETEGYIRDKFQDPMCRMLQGGGAIALRIYEEGPNSEQFEKGDLEYTIGDNLVTVDLKGDRTVYPGCTLFYETWSNFPKRQGWGRKPGTLRIWYAFYQLGLVVVLNLPAWREEAEAWLAQNPAREKVQSKNAQSNITKGLSCKPADLLRWDRARVKDGLPPIIVGVCQLVEGEIQPMSSSKGIALLLSRAANRNIWDKWPDEA